MKELINKNPLVYIVLPCYNGEKYLLEQLMSIYYQNYTNWYLIFVNDGSTDNSENILRDWISHYNLHDKVKVITKENGGVTSAVQRGLEEIKNMCNIQNTDSLVSYCDSDDIRARNKLEIQVKYMINHTECGLSFHDLTEIDENGNIIRSSHLKKIYKKDLSFFFRATNRNYITSTEMMFRIKYIEDLLPMPIEKCIYQDTWTTFALSLLGYNIQYIDKCLAYYRQGHTSLMNIAGKMERKERYKNRIKIFSYLQNRFPQKNLTYITNYNKDRYIKRYNYGLVSFKSYFLLLIKYPRIFFYLLKLLIKKSFL